MVKLFGRRGKVIARNKIRCPICGLEKEVTHPALKGEACHRQVSA